MDTKGTQNAQMQGAKDPRGMKEGWMIDRPGQAKESFGAGPMVSSIG